MTDGLATPTKAESSARKAKAELIDRLVAGTEKALDATTEIACAGPPAEKINALLQKAARDALILASEIATSDEVLRERFENQLTQLAQRALAT